MGGANAFPRCLETNPAPSSLSRDRFAVVGSYRTLEARTLADL